MYPSGPDYGSVEVGDGVETLYFYHFRATGDSSRSPRDPLGASSVYFELVGRGLESDREALGVVRVARGGVPIGTGEPDECEVGPTDMNRSRPGKRCHLS